MIHCNTVGSDVVLDLGWYLVNGCLENTLSKAKTKDYKKPR